VIEIPFTVLMFVIDLLHASQKNTMIFSASDVSPFCRAASSFSVLIKSIFQLQKTLQENYMQW